MASHQGVALESVWQRRFSVRARIYPCRECLKISAASVGPKGRSPSGILTPEVSGTYASARLLRSTPNVFQPEAIVVAKRGISNRILVVAIEEVSEMSHRGKSVPEVDAV